MSTERLAAKAAPELDADEQVAVREQLKKMRQNLQNVLLRAGHQSPDYQWWYGQPASMATCYASAA